MNTLPLEPALRATSAKKLLTDVRTARGADLRLDASKVEFLSGACLQVLISAAETWRAEGAAFEIADASDAFRRDVATLGAAAHLRLVEEDAA